MSNYGVGGGPLPDVWLVDELGIFSRGWIHQKYNEKRKPNFKERTLKIPKVIPKEYDS